MSSTKEILDMWNAGIISFDETRSMLKANEEKLNPLNKIELPISESIYKPGLKEYEELRNKWEETYKARNPTSYLKTAEVSEALELIKRSHGAAVHYGPTTCDTCKAIDIVRDAIRGCHISKADPTIHTKEPKACQDDEVIMLKSKADCLQTLADISIVIRKAKELTCYPCDEDEFSKGPCSCQGNADVLEDARETYEDLVDSIKGQGWTE